MNDRLRDGHPLFVWSGIVAQLAAGVACYVLAWAASSGAVADARAHDKAVGVVSQATRKIAVTSSGFEGRVTAAEAKAMRSHLKEAEGGLAALEGGRSRADVPSVLRLSDPLAVMVPWLIFGEPGVRRRVEPTAGPNGFPAGLGVVDSPRSRRPDTSDVYSVGVIGDGRSGSEVAGSFRSATAAFACNVR